MAGPGAAVRVRPATPADRAFVLDTARRLVGFEPPPSRTRELLLATDAATLSGYFGRLRRARRALVSLLQGRPRAEILIAESASAERLGFVYVHRAADYFTGREISYLSVIAVAAAAEGEGVGSVLLRAVESWARERGHPLVMLNVFAANTRARTVYERSGYVCETVRYVKVLSPPASEPPRELAADSHDVHR